MRNLHEIVFNLQSSCSVAALYAFRWLGDNGHKVHLETLASTILQGVPKKVTNRKNQPNSTKEFKSLRVYC